MFNSYWNEILLWMGIEKRIFLYNNITLCVFVFEIKKNNF